MDPSYYLQYPEPSSQLSNQYESYPQSMYGPIFPYPSPFLAYALAMQSQQDHKKRRRRLEHEETQLLLDAYKDNPRPSASVREILAKNLNMSSRAVQIWFQNRRAKTKRDNYNRSVNFAFSAMNTPISPPITLYPYSPWYHVNVPPAPLIFSSETSLPSPSFQGDILVSRSQSQNHVFESPPKDSSDDLYISGFENAL